MHERLNAKNVMGYVFHTSYYAAEESLRQPGEEAENRSVGGTDAESTSYKEDSLNKRSVKRTTKLAEKIYWKTSDIIIPRG